MTPEEGQEIYQAEVNRLAPRFGWDLPIQKGMRSDVDFQVARGLSIRWHLYPEDIVAVLMYGSEKAAERGMDYVISTVQKAMEMEAQAYS